MSSSEGERPLRVLFSMRNYWYVRHFDSVIRALCGNGHQVHLLAERAANDQANDWSASAQALAASVPGVTFDTAPRADEDVWYDLRVILRLGLDYLRFTTEQYRPLTQLVARARERTPRWLRRIAESAAGRSLVGRRMLTSLLAAAERVLPPDPTLAEYIAGYAPDLVAVTPLVELGSEQADVVRVAQRLGIPAVLCVGSWDHLSSKGLIRTLPDRVLVWNETQKREAAEMHGVPAARIVVTGAQVFDGWFDRRPSLDRAAFCAKVGLDPQQPFVVYACSALFEGSPSEAALVERWIAAVRSHPELQRVGILVRPHPKRDTELTAVDADRLAQTVVWPRVATAPSSPLARDEYFDSLYHSAAVVGINTSAMIEAGIVGRPVLTVLEPAYAGNQTGTLHFSYLLEGGLLRAADTLEEHVVQLAAVVGHGRIRHNDEFVRAFVRPQGLDQDATSRVVGALLDAARTPGSATVERWPEAIGRALLWPAARATYGRFAQQVARARRRRIEDEERTRRQAEGKAARERIRIARDEARIRDRAEAIARREADREAIRQARRVAAEESRRREEAERQARLEAKLAAVAQRQAEKERREQEAKAALHAARQRAKAERFEQHRLAKRKAAGKP